MIPVRTVLRQKTYLLLGNRTQQAPAQLVLGVWLFRPFVGYLLKMLVVIRRSRKELQWQRQLS